MKENRIMQREFQKEKRLAPTLGWDDIRDDGFVDYFLGLTPETSRGEINDFNEEEQRYKKLDKVQRIVYALKFSPLFGGFDGRRSEVSTARRDLQFLQDPMLFGLFRNYSVSFDEDCEMKDEEFWEGYLRLFFEKGGIDLSECFGCTDRMVTEDLKWSSDKEKFLERRINSILNEIVGTYLEKEHLKDAMTENVSSLMEAKGMDLSVYESCMRNRGSRFRACSARQNLANFGIGLESTLTFGYEDCNLGVVAASAIGDVVESGCLKKSVEKIIEMLNIGGEEFLQAMIDNMGSVGSEVIHEKTGSEISPKIEAESGPKLEPEIQEALEVYATITKAVSVAVNVGVTRVVLTDDEDALMIELDGELKLEDVSYKNDKLPQLLRCRYKWLSKTEHLFHLLYFSFVLPTEAYIKKLGDFKARVQRVFEEEVLKLTGSLSDPHHCMRDGASIASRMKLSRRKFEYLEEAFEHHSYVKFGDAFQAFVAEGVYGETDTFIVNPSIFLEFVPEKFVFGDAYQVGSACLKFFGLEWVSLWQSGRWYVSDNLDKSYKIEACKHELEILERLEPLMGDLVPRVYSYGYAVDVTVRVGQSYSVFNGPYILMEAFVPKNDYEKVLRGEAFFDKVIPALKRFHEYGVVYGSYYFDNMILTTEGDLKFLDFQRSFFSDDTRQFQREIESVIENRNR